MHLAVPVKIIKSVNASADTMQQLFLLFLSSETHGNVSCVWSKLHEHCCHKDIKKKEIE